VEGGIRIDRSRQQCRWAACADLARQQVAHQAGQDKAERLRELDAPKDAASGQVEQRGDIVGQGRVKAQRGVAQPIGRVGHPACWKYTLPQVTADLFDALQEKGRISPGARGDDPGAYQQRQCGQKGQQERQG